MVTWITVWRLLMIVAEKEQLIIVTSNDGGYLSGRCALCNEYGGINCDPRIQHKENCPLKDPNVNDVLVMRITFY